MKQAYGEQVAADESFALAVVVPESVTRFINEQHDIKTEPKQRYIVSQDTSMMQELRMDTVTARETESPK